MKLAEMKCAPCEGTVDPVAVDEAMRRLVDISGWRLVEEGKRIEKRFKFRDFASTLGFVNRIGTLAENEGHHPDICFGYGYCLAMLQTHAIRGLSENDFIMAAKINDIR